MKLVELAFFTDNVQDMADFYRRLLNAEPVAQSESMAIFMVGSTKIFIHRSYTPKNGELPPEDHIALEVEDIDAACQSLVAQGLSLEIPPKDYYWGRSAYLRDTDGHQIEITQTKSE
ncbi:MAG: VOC family protein [Anaerolineales bacterium]